LPTRRSNKHRSPCPHLLRCICRPKGTDRMFVTEVSISQRSRHAPLPRLDRSGAHDPKRSSGPDNSGGGQPRSGNVEGLSSVPMHWSVLAPFRSAWPLLSFRVTRSQLQKCHGCKILFLNRCRNARSFRRIAIPPDSRCRIPAAQRRGIVCRMPGACRVPLVPLIPWSL